MATQLKKWNGFQFPKSYDLGKSWYNLDMRKLGGCGILKLHMLTLVVAISIDLTGYTDTKDKTGN